MKSFHVKDGKLLFCGLSLDFPAIRVQIGKKLFVPQGEGEKTGPQTWCFHDGSLTFYVSLEEIGPDVLRKKIRIHSPKKTATPEWVETDRQRVPDSAMTLRGYRASTAAKCRPGSEEEGGSLKPGCGYPLIGKHFFAGSEHPASFAEIQEQGKTGTVYSIKQHPVWDDDNAMELAGVVFSRSDDPEKTFFDYLNTVRIPPLKKPVFSFCSFWSDPYLGKYEYLIDPDNYRSFVNAFYSMGLIPDFYTLDAGWQNRKSIFDPKDSFHGSKGLWDLEKYIRRHGSRMGLWVSHNGPMGCDPEYLKSRGFAVGSGESSTYCGDGYGVLLDKKFEEAICSRWAELARAGVMHFKMDWDNDCATNSTFSKKYPTRNHVREASINAMIRIAKRIRQENSDLVMRSGWWPSPWWLMHVHHIFLPDSNDSEYTSLPSRTQRDSAATYRDTMYYCCFSRDKSAFPLDAVDNHEYPHAMRNPFHETPSACANNAVLSVMRGTSYHPFTLQPEALEPWFADILKNVMSFARAYGKFWYTARSAMFGGNPNAGAIYGYRFEQEDGSCWCVLRNPSAMPQRFRWSGEKRSGVMLYPFFAYVDPAKMMTFTPHEVKVVLLSRQRMALPFEQPFQAVRDENGKTVFRFPSPLEINSKVKPMVNAIYQIPAVEFQWKECKSIENGLKLLFKIRLPYRMREMTLNVTASAEAGLTVRQGRSATSESQCVNLPVTRLSPSLPGYGELRNLDTVVPCKESLFTVPVAEGGEAWYSLFLSGITSTDQLKLSISGFYAPSCNAVTRSWKPSWLEEVLPPVHPAGFPMAEFLTIPDVEKS